MTRPIRSWADDVQTPGGRTVRRRIAGDVALWGMLSLALVLGMSLQFDHDSPWAKLLTGVCLFGVAVALRHAYPLVSLTITAAPSLAQLWGVWDASFWPTPLTVAMAVMSYLAGRTMARAAPAAAVFTVSAVAVTVLIAVPYPQGGPGIRMVILLAFPGVLAWLLGRYVRQRAQLVAAGWQRAEQLEREQRIVAEQARLRERSRIAQDMHDSLGHELSLIALRAGGLEVAPDLDARHRGVAGELRSAATTATEHLREVIGVLRDSSGSLPTEPGHESITELVERARASGMAVRLEREGDGADVVSMVDRAAYRVVQESLTNATKHAPGAAAIVRLEHRHDETVVTVSNEVSPSGSSPDPAQGNYGLTGLRERVRLVGGTLDARPRDGGFEVVARLPHRPGAVSGGQMDNYVEESESARQLSEQQRRVRRRFVTAIAVPLALSAALIASWLAYFSYAVSRSVLEPSEFARLRAGQDRAAVEAVLPARQIVDGPVDHDPPKPDGARCAYYRSTGNIFASELYIFRLCFDDGRLVSKDAIHPGRDAPEDAS